MLEAKSKAELDKLDAATDSIEQNADNVEPIEVKKPDIAKELQKVQKKEAN